MSTLEWLYLALAVAVLGVGLALVAALWQVTVLIATLRAALLPQIQVLLSESQKSLVHVESITQDVEHKLSRLDDTVGDVTVTTRSLAQVARFFSEGVARPLLISVASLLTGAGAAWKRYRELQREDGHAVASGRDSSRIEEKGEAGRVG